ncbi:MAG: EamA family transporter [Alphaproteobacteria bacterium]|nr:EamA family transporter [Alphaproteobacteria bacterium]
MTPSLKQHPLGDYALLVVLAVVWGGSFSLIKVAVETLPPLTIAAVRIALAAAILLLIARAAGEVLPSLAAAAGRRIWMHFLAVGMLGNGVPFTLVSWGEKEVSASLAAILIGVMPVFTVALARLTGIEPHFGWRRVGGICVGFGALVLLLGPAALGEIGGRTVLAQLAIAGAAASYATTAVYAKRLTFTVPTLTLAAGTMTACAVVMVPVAMVFDTPWTLHPSAGAVASVAALAVFPTALASIVYFRLLVSAGPTFASMINYLIPAFGAAVGIVWLGESISAAEVAALTLILAAIALVRNPVVRAPGNPDRPAS